MPPEKSFRGHGKKSWTKYCADEKLCVSLFYQNQSFTNKKIVHTMIKDNVKIFTIVTYAIGDATVYIYPTLDKCGTWGFAKHLNVNGELWEEKNITREEFDLLVKRITRDFQDTLSRMETAFDKGCFEQDGEIVCPTIPEKDRWEL